MDDAWFATKMMALGALLGCTLATLVALVFACWLFRFKDMNKDSADAVPRDEAARATPATPDQTPAERCVAEGTRLLQTRGNEEAAKQLFEDAIVLDNCASAHVALGQLAQRRGDSATAQASYKAAILANPRDPLASHLLCVLERNEESRAMLEHASREAQQLRDAGALETADAPAWFVEALRQREEHESRRAR